VVGVYGSAEAARQANFAQMHGTQDGLLLDSQSRALPLAHPVNATTEWLRGYLSRPSPQFVGHPRDCYAMGGIRYQNVLMLAQVDDWGAVTPRGQAPCQMATSWTTRVLAALYARAAHQGPVPVPAAQPAPAATPGPDPAQEFGTVVGAEQFATTQLSNFATLSQLKDEGLLSAQTFGTTAQQLQHTPDQIIDNLRAMPMSGRYATARTLLLDALRNVTYLWESVMASGGQSYDVGYYRIALAELQTAEQYVSPS
jgi:hypothetical protein